MSLLFDRAYKLGWGCTPTGRLVPFKGSPPDCQQHLINFSTFNRPSTVTCDNPPTFYLGELLKEECRRFFDFCILFSEEEYWKITWSLIRRKDICESLPEYHHYCNLYIKEVNYGIDLRIFFPKKGLPSDPEKVYNLLTEAKLDEIQEQIPCKVLINSEKVSEMTLGEMLQHTRELKGGEIIASYIPISCHFSNRDSLLFSHFKKQPNFWLFLWHLYYVFRKIEVKLEKMKIVDATFTPKSKEELTLDVAKNNFISMEESDFLKMYPVIKQLFHSYMDYVEESFENSVEFTEGNHLPGTIEELKKWLRELNSTFIVKCPGYGHIIEKLCRTNRFKNWDTVESSIANQPFIDINNERVLFGFINMEGAEAVDVPKDAVLLEKKCLSDCTDEIQKWICMKCGDFMSIKNWNLYCSCGRKKYKDKLLICIHRYHCKWDLENAPVLVTPTRYKRVASDLLQTAKYSGINIIEDPDAREPYIGDPHGDEHFFGFVNMDGAELREFPNDLKFLQQTCPDDCTHDIRKWVCTKCGDFVYFENWILYCSCGSKVYKEKFLFCYHSSHLETTDSEVELITTEIEKLIEDKAITYQKIDGNIEILSDLENNNLIANIVKDEIQKG